MKWSIFIISLNDLFYGLKSIQNNCNEPMKKTFSFIRYENNPFHIAIQRELRVTFLEVARSIQRIWISSLAQCRARNLIARQTNATPSKIAGLCWKRASIERRTQNNESNVLDFPSRFFCVFIFHVITLIFNTPFSSFYAPFSLIKW